MSAIGSQITIGVAIRFEPPESLTDFCRRLERAARVLDSSVETEVIFCLNAADPATESFVKKQAAALDSFSLPFRAIHSKPGKIHAHRAVAGSRDFSGSLLFCDADIEFGEGIFLLLHRALEESRESFATYAEVEAKPDTGCLLGRLQQHFYSRKRRLPLRRHLHGRCFLLRSWLEEFCPETCDVHSHAPGHLNLESGPTVDDIHYSRVIAHRFGPEGIRRVPEAKVAYAPPHSWGELYRDTFRTEYELARLSLLFPEHNYLQKDVFARKWSALNRARHLGLQGGLYYLIEKIMARHARRAVIRKRQCPRSWKSQGQNHHG